MSQAEPRKSWPVRIRRLLKIAAKILVTLVVLVVVLVGLLYWRLTSGPVSFGFLTTTIEDGFANSVTDYLLDIEETILVLDRAEDSLSLQIRAIAILDSGGEVLASIPSATVKLGFRALLHRVLALSEIQIEGAQVNLARDTDGQVHLGRVPVAAAEEENAATAEPEREKGDDEKQKTGDSTDVVNQFFAALMAAPNPDRPLTYLKVLRLTRAGLFMDDRRWDITWQASEVDLRLERSDVGLAGGLSFEIPLAQHTATLQSSLEYLKDEENLRLEATIADLWLPDLGAVTGIERLSAIDIMCDGSFSLVTSERGHVRHVAFSLQAEPGNSADSGPTVTVEGHGKGGEGESVIETEMTIAGLPIQRLPDYWPVALAPGARQWITQNIPTGTVTTVEADIELALPAGNLKSMQMNHFTGKLSFEDLVVHFLRPLPPVRGIAGGGTFDLNGFHLETGKAALADLEIDETRVDITGLSDKRDALAVEVELQGVLRSVLTLLDDPSLDLISGLGLVPERVTGSVKTHASIALPLRGRITLAEVVMKFQGDLQDVGMSDVFAGHDVENGNLAFTVDNDGMRLTGPVGFAGIPLTIDWREAFSSRGPEQRRIQVTARRLDETNLRDLGLDVGDYLAGPLAVRVGATFAHDGHAVVTADLVLNDARLSVPPLKWRKDAGTPGHVSAVVELMGMRPVAVDTVHVEAGSLVTAGSAGFDSTTGEFRRLDLSRFAFGTSDLHGISLGKNGDTWSVRIDGGVFDAAPFLARADSVRETESGAVTDAASDSSEPGVAFSFSVDSLSRIYFAEDRYLQDVQLSLDRDTQSWRQIQIFALAPATVLDTGATPTDNEVTETSEISLWYGPAGGDTLALFVKVEDVGDLLQATALHDDIDGGSLAIRGWSTQPGRNLPLQAQIRIKDLVVTETSTIAHILNSALVKGLLDSKQSKSLTYERLACDLVWDQGVITVERLGMRGKELGITAKGTVDYGSGSIDINGSVIPARKVNTLLGRIPLLGNILHGGEGMIATDYTVTGSLSKPDISVDALSTVTPDFLKDIFDNF